MRGIKARGSGGGSGATAIDVFVIAGQSNAEGRGSSASSPSVRNASLEYDGSSLVALADPVGDANTGSAWPAFANAYHTASGRLVCIVETAASGARLYPDTSGTNWSPSGTLTAAAVTKTTNAITALEAAGYTPYLRGILWSQGEGDAQDGVSEANYQAALIDLHDRLEASLGLVGFYVFQTGSADDGSNASQWAAIREAQRTACAETLRMEMASDVQQDFPALGYMGDNLHYDQTGLNLMGEVGGYHVARSVTRTLADLDDVDRDVAPTKGSVLVGDGDQWREVGGGTDDQVLTRDSTTTAGAAWKDPAAGGTSTDVWMPLTTVVGGVPELVWDDDNSLIPTKVPT